MNTDKKKPIQLISFNSNKQIVVNQEAVNWLMKVNQQKHIGIITVVGKYRTGKSYILNRVLLNQNSGFEVGPTVNACTKGLWVWPQLIDNPNDPTIQYMVMDTEGLGSLEQGQQTDTKIFLMAMLLSSYFIYNSMGSIDEKAVQSLSLIVNLSKLLQKGGNDKEMQDLINCFPSFMWLVRDFALRLQDTNGRKLSPKQYLQNALKIQNQSNEMSKRKNTVRKQLVNFFKERDCFMLIRPVDDEHKLQNMANSKDSDIRPQFLALIKQLRTKIMLNIKKKTFKGKPCSPAMFIELCQYFCTSINTGGLPQIQSNWDLVCRSQSNRLQKRCLQDYKRFLKVYESKKPAEVDLKKFEIQANNFILGILKFFEKNAYGDKLQKKKMMKEVMQQDLQKLKKKISLMKNEILNSTMDKINNEVYQMINNDSVGSIMEVSQKYDQIIDKQSKGVSQYTLSLLYKKCYEGLRTNGLTLFGNFLQSHNHETQLLQSKLDFYQNSLNKVNDENSKNHSESDSKQRQLRQYICKLQLKSKATLQQLQKTQRQLMLMKKMQETQKKRQAQKQNFMVYN